MPRIKAALALLAVAVFCIGFNAVRYPAVWDMVAASTETASAQPRSGSAIRQAAPEDALPSPPAASIRAGTSAERSQVATQTDLWGHSVPKSEDGPDHTSPSPRKTYEPPATDHARSEEPYGSSSASAYGGAGHFTGTDESSGLGTGDGDTGNGFSAHDGSRADHSWENGYAADPSENDSTGQAAAMGQEHRSTSQPFASHHEARVGSSGSAREQTGRSDPAQGRSSATLGGGSSGAETQKPVRPGAAKSAKASEQVRREKTAGSRATVAGTSASQKRGAKGKPPAGQTGQGDPGQAKGVASAKSTNANSSTTGEKTATDALAYLASGPVSTTGSDAQGRWPSSPGESAISAAASPSGAPWSDPSLSGSSGVAASSGTTLGNPAPSDSPAPEADATAQPGAPPRTGYSWANALWSGSATSGLAASARSGLGTCGPACTGSTCSLPTNTRLAAETRPESAASPSDKTNQSHGGSWGSEEPSPRDGLPPMVPVVASARLAGDSYSANSSAHGQPQSGYGQSHGEFPGGGPAGASPPNSGSSGGWGNSSADGHNDWGRASWPGSSSSSSASLSVRRLPPVEQTAEMGSPSADFKSDGSVPLYPVTRPQ